VSLQRRLTAEALGTGFLLIDVVGSGFLGERLAAGNTAIALLANALTSGRMPDESNDIRNYDHSACSTNSASLG
jgi:hypothetical protein